MGIDDFCRPEQPWNDGSGAVRNLDLEEIRNSVGRYLEQDWLKSDSWNDSDRQRAIRHIFNQISILKDRKQIWRYEQDHSNGFVSMVVPAVADPDSDKIFTYTEEFNPYFQFLRLIYDIGVADVNVDYTTGPIIDAIEYIMTEDAGVKDLLSGTGDADPPEKYNLYWRVCVFILIRLANHILDNTSHNVERIAYLLRTLINYRNEERDDEHDAWFLKRRVDQKSQRVPRRDIGPGDGNPFVENHPERAVTVFSDGQNMVTHYEGVLAIHRLNDILHFDDDIGGLHALKGRFLDEFDVLDEDQRRNLEDPSESDSGKATFFWIRPRNALIPNMRYANIHFRSSYYREYGDYRFDIDPAFGHEPSEDKSAAGIAVIEQTVADDRMRTIDLFRLSFMYHNKYSHNLADDPVKGDLIYRNIRTQYALESDPSLKWTVVDPLYDAGAANSGCSGNTGFNKPSARSEWDKLLDGCDLAIRCCGNDRKIKTSQTVINVKILKAFINISAHKLVEAEGILDELRSPEYAGILSNIQKARIEEAIGRIMIRRIDDSVGQDELRFYAEARKHYVLAEGLSRSTSRRWIHMRLMSEVYLIDWKLNYPKELKLRSAALVTYLKTKDAKAHSATYRKIVSNLTRGRSE